MSHRLLRTSRRSGLLAAVLLSTSTYADVAVQGHGSTLGLGVGLTVGVTEQVNVRAVLSTFDYDFDDEASDVDYNFELGLANYGALLDWHPGGGGFRISAGVFINDNDVSGDGAPTNPTVEIGNVVFPSSEVGTLTTEVEFDSVVPYVGVGWGNAVGAQQRLTFGVDVGVLFQGEGDVTFRSIGANPLIQDQLDAQIANEEADIQDDLDDFDLYPVLTLAISYRF